MKIKISALDTLFFKDGKPFSMGEESWASGVFPPPPSVFYGALRTLYLSVFPNAFKQLNTVDPTDSLRINNLVLQCNGDKIFPCPGDFVVQAKEETYELLTMKNCPLTTSYPLAKLLQSDNQVKSQIGTAFIQEAFFKYDYLQGNQPHSVFNLKELLLAEPKVGIGRDNMTKTAAEGQLYRVGMNRLQNKTGQKLDFFIDFDGLDFEDKLPDSGFLKLGAENKSVRYEILENEENLSIDKVEVSQYFKIVLSTPAVFKNGWYPDFLDKDYKGTFKQSLVKLVGAVVGKPISIGGFDMKKKRPKPMFKAVPAGSTYFLEITDNTSFLTEFLPSKLACINQLENQGFGIYYTGLVTKQN